MVGILLPPSVGGAITNIAFLLAGKTPVNLNFTIGYAGNGFSHQTMQHPDNL